MKNNNWSKVCCCYGFAAEVSLLQCEKSSLF